MGFDPSIVTVKQSSIVSQIVKSRVFVAAYNGSGEVLELVALFLLTTGTFSAENW